MMSALAKLRAGAEAAAKTMKIERLKRKARGLYLQRAAMLDETDCGHALKMFISSGYASVDREFKKTWAELRELCPECPELQE
jgi:hypothetical protein